MSLIVVVLTSIFSGIVPTCAAGNTISVYGYFTYDGKPIKNALVEVKDSDPGLDDHLEWGYTDENGYYYISGISNDDGWLSGGNDVFVKCYAYNDAVNVLGNPEWMPDSVMHGCTYSFRTSVKSDRKDGSSTNMGTKPAPSDIEGAFSIFDVVTEGHNFVRSIVGSDPPRVNAFWHDYFTPGSSYYMPSGAVDYYTLDQWWSLLVPFALSGLGIVPTPLPVVTEYMSERAVMKSLIGIHIEDDNAFLPETILHEYGHFVMDTYSEFYPPYTDMHHSYLDHKYPQHAWGEGWAEFFSCAARKWAGYSYLWVGNYNIEENYEGADVEGAVAGLLWDLYDSSSFYGEESEDDDNASIPLSTLFDVFEAYKPPDPDGNYVSVPRHIWDVYDLFYALYDEKAYLINDIYDAYMLHAVELPDFKPAPIIEVRPNNQYLNFESDTSTSYTITLKNKGTATDTYELSVARSYVGLGTYSFSYDEEITIAPNQAATTTLIVTRHNSNKKACPLDVDWFTVEAKSKSSGVVETASFSLQIDYQPVGSSTPQGGIVLAITPKRIKVEREGGRECAYFNVTLFNNENFDDVINVRFDFDGVSSEYRPEPRWFSYIGELAQHYHHTWTNNRVYVPAKSSYTIELKIILRPEYDSWVYWAIWLHTPSVVQITPPDGGFWVFKVSATAQIDPGVKASDSVIIMPSQ